MDEYRLKLETAYRFWVTLSGWVRECFAEGKMKAVTHRERSSVNKILLIRAEWDSEALVWVATSDDLPGLSTEAETLEALSAKLEVMVPELLDANGYPEGPEVPYELLARRLSMVHRIAR